MTESLTTPSNIVPGQRYLNTVCVLIWLAFFSAGIRADSPPVRKATIKGRVHTSERVPADATVVVLKWKSGEKLCDTCYTKTEAAGNYSIEDIPSGQHTLKAYDKAGRSQEQHPKVNDGENSIDFILPHTPTVRRKGKVRGPLGAKIGKAEMVVSVCEGCPPLVGFSTNDEGEFESADLAIGETFWIGISVEGKTVKPLEATIWPEYATLEIVDSSTGVGQQLAFVDGQRIEMYYLPFRHRLLDLSVLVPGNVASRLQTGLSVNGASTSSSNFVIDGADYSDSFAGARTFETTLTFFPNKFSAEPSSNRSVSPTPFDNNSLISLSNAFQGRSGTNSLHGSVVYGIGNDALDARHFFNLPGFETFRSHNAWANLGGPIRKDHLFFFVSYVFSRSTEAPAFSPILVSQLDALNRQLERLGLPPEDLRRFLKESSSDIPTLRLDYHPSDRHSLWARYQFERDLISKAIFNERGGVSGAPSSALDISGANHSLGFSHSWSISQRLLNKASYGYTRVSGAFDPVEPRELSVLIQGLALIGRAPNLSSGDRHTKTTQQFSDDLVIARSQHSLKVGGQFIHENNEFRFESFASGRAIVPGLAALSSSTPIAELFQIGTGGSRVRFASRSTGFYFQDDYRASQTLTLNLGIRYDAEFPPSFHNSQLDGWQPRLGLAWDVTGRGKSLVRAGYGIFLGRLPQSPFGFQLLMGGQGLQTDFPSPVRKVTSFIGEQAATSAFNQFLTQREAPPGPQMATTYDRNSQRAFYQNAGISLETLFWSRWSFEASYAFGAASRVLSQKNLNLPPPTLIDGRPDFGNLVVDPAFAQIYSFESAGRISHHSGTLKLRGRKLYASGKSFNLDASYTFSKSIDDTPAGSFEATPENVFDRRNERALSSWSAKHYLTIFSSVDAPKPNWDLSWLASALGSLYLNNTLIYRSGLNYNVLTGSDSNHDGNPLTDRPFGIGRNTFLGQNFVRLDVRVGSYIKLNEAHRIRLQAEVSNILNRANFDDFHTVLGQSDRIGIDPTIVSGKRALPSFDFRRPLAPGGFGIASSAAAPRRIQLEIRYTF